MIWFLDASALVKRFAKEPGSVWLRREIVSHDLLIAQITPIEVAAALKRKWMTGRISEFAFFSGSPSTPQQPYEPAIQDCGDESAHR